MAQMIPTEIFYGKEYDTESGAEMALFKIIKNEPNTKDWICFHSLNIQAHECLCFTEADFVILIPSRGIFIIEVKGGEIHYHNGRFVSIDKRGEDHDINPFEQVQKAQFGIINYLKRQNINNVLVATGVAFTSVEFNVESIEYDQSAIYHIGSGSFYDYIVNLERMTKMQHGLYRKDFSGDTFDKVRNLLRGDYDKFVPLYQRVKENKFRTEYLTVQQREVLDAISCTDRALVHGGAGTGKTYFAVEMAKRCYNNGYKVGIFSYNILLSEYLKDQFPQKKYPNIIVGAILEFLLQYCKDLRIREKDFDPMKLPEPEMQKYYTHDIYKDALTAFQMKPLDLDVLILDESQDYVEPNKLMLLSLMLKHNLARGKWYMFGDYINQLIFDFSVYETNIKQYLKAMGVDNYIDKELSKNCRNSQAIANELLRLTGLNVPALDKNCSGKVEYIQYLGVDEEIKLFETLLDKLLIEEKIKPEQITILTNCKYEDSFPVQCSKYKLKIQKYENREVGIISYARLRRFKGLENDVIIMMDLNNYILSDNNKSSISLLYSGLSRAIDSCYIFETDGEKQLREVAYRIE
ncbi:MAG: NERD domain-containing protein/DEAD/DEAH box helicase [Eubacteriales bacterium]|nr:NERD domain-containing protein/DEAD/DEAH box helicase [Eubacteriales bacterium]